ncbi:SYNTHETASE C2, ASPARAGINYL-TRNA SYNTHETASE 2, asparaginyl-tRNA synthetase 2 [Hibiscus trionum]|uniref:asparagine--tRNA ligase n=1 Tax=Hibiscus trionum TaxID=183268 RepID=A0A9W7GVG9_HIBTR|nr:SYNTHETASE C2, ASPARAGINYL-TRNA SYNTHETASE 2, asparaginyl-tRNA synthetase 2 [Hibiscus trionum]
MESQEPNVTKSPLMHSNRVLVKTVLEGSDVETGFVGTTVVVGGWVKSSKEVKKEPVPPPSPSPPMAADARRAAPSGTKDVSCVEILQSQIPFFRTIIRVLGGSASSPAVRQKLESLIPKPPPPSTFFLEINDGSCVSSLKVVIDSAIVPVPAGQILPTGTCVLAQGVLEKPSAHGKQIIELKVEKILHVGTVEQDKYPLSRKRLPLDSLRDYPHIRPRTTTVASVTRIRSALDFATHTFFQNHGFLHVQVPIITTTDPEGFSEKFQVTTLLGETSKKEASIGVSDSDGVSLETVKAAIKEKSSLVEQLKRSDSNREALAAAIQDLRKSNELAQQVETREKSKPVTAVKPDLVNFNADFFGRQSYLTVSGRIHLESYACALGHVYSFGPRFQADKRVSAKHVAEMWTAEAEMAFTQLEDAMKCAEDYFKFLCRWILDNCSDDMKFISKRIDKTVADRLEYMASSSYEKISYREAVEILRKVIDKAFDTQLQWGVPLTDEHLSYLADDHYRRPVIIYDYPKAVKPFYVRLNDDRKTVAAFEMVVPQIGTVVTGSQNEERFDILNTRIKEFDLSKDQYEWYLDLRRYGTVKHSGFSLGFDLMVLLATGLTDVRDVIPFTRSHGKANN